MINDVIELSKSCKSIFTAQDFSVENKISLSVYVTTAYLKIGKFLRQELTKLLPDDFFSGKNLLNFKNTKPLIIKAFKIWHTILSFNVL